MPAGLRSWVAVGVVVSALAPLVAPAAAREGDRTLRFYYTHTKESGEFTFKKHGRYDRAALDKLNYFLRDWRRNEPAKMDPQLLDLVWAIQQQSGSNQPIYIVSSYRAPKTNEMLRSRSRGVAENSQHTKGKAMDFFIPGVPLAKLRALALKLQVGGVGYYPASGSPFVHVDTGSVRMWPRMTRTQLAALFPDGNTMYVPSDGKPLAGYASAKAKYGKSKEVALAALSASAAPAEDKANVGDWLKKVFKPSDNNSATAGVTGAPAPAAPTAPVLAARPATAGPAELVALASVAPAPLPRVRPQAQPVETFAVAEAAAPGDPIAELAARMDAGLPTAASPTLALAARAAAARMPGSAAAAAAELVGQGRPAAPPYPRPATQLAYSAPLPAATHETAYGGRYATVPRTGPRTGPAMGPEEPITVAALPKKQSPAAAAEPVALRVEQAIAAGAQPDSEDLRRLMSKLTTRTKEFAALARPEPSNGAVLFAAPDSAASGNSFSGGAPLRTDRFEAASPRPAAASSVQVEASLIERLFATY